MGFKDNLVKQKDGSYLLKSKSKKTKDGNVFHKGKEQPKLKGTLKPTKVTAPKKKVKRRSKEQMLVARHKEKKAELKKAVQKQKDFLNHKLGGLNG